MKSIIGTQKPDIEKDFSNWRHILQSQAVPLNLSQPSRIYPFGLEMVIAVPDAFPYFLASLCLSCTNSKAVQRFSQDNTYHQKSLFFENYL